MKKSIFKAKAENVDLLDCLIRPDILQSIKVLHLRSTDSAAGTESGFPGMLAYHQDKIRGPGALVARMGSLKQYSLEIELGYVVHWPMLTVGHVIAARGGASVVLPFSTLVIFRHYICSLNPTRTGIYSMFRFKRSWSILFLARSQTIRVERLLQMEQSDSDAPNFYVPCDLRCAYCFGNGDVVRDFQRRVVCPECEMAVYCSQNCLDWDFDRHQLNECTFDLSIVGNNLDNFAGQQPGNQGYTCDMVTTIWGDHGRICR